MKTIVLITVLFSFLRGYSQEPLNLDLPYNQRGYKHSWNETQPLEVNPEHIIYLDCRKAKNIDSLLAELPKFKKIEWLSLYGLNLKELPDIFGNFPFLKFIDISLNQLKKLPPSFNSLTELEYAHINGNNLDKLPDMIYKLELKELLIAGNALSDTFTIAESWNRLTRLDLSGTSIHYISGIEHLHKTESFGLTACKNLKSLPDTFKKCRKLKSLYINNTPLQDLPKSLLKLNTLYYILLENSEIPKTLLYEYRVRYPRKVFDDCPNC
jgi:Leucine-rich repeat (LRR) protein